MRDQSALVAWIKTRRLAVLKGGWSSERSISLKTGAAVEDAFRRMGIKFQSVDVTPQILAVLIKKKINFCFNALHGSFGEDGMLQALLHSQKIPYTGTGVLSSAVAMDKDISKQLFQSKKVPTAPWTVVQKSNAHSRDVQSALKQFLKKGSAFVKPVDQGSAVATHRVDRFSQLSSALSSVFKVSDRAMVERFVAGRELTVGILGPMALPVIEIRPKHNFYDFHSKYAPGGSTHLTPAPLPSKISQAVQQTAINAFNALGCEVYGRVDILLTKNNSQSVLEVNTIPGMTTTSLLPEAARAIGIHFDELVLRIVDLSRKRRGA